MIGQEIAYLYNKNWCIGTVLEQTKRGLFTYIKVKASNIRYNGNRWVATKYTLHPDDLKVALL